MSRFKFIPGLFLLTFFLSPSAHALGCWGLMKVCNNSGQKIKLYSMGWKYKDTGDWKQRGFGTEK